MGARVGLKVVGTVGLALAGWQIGSLMRGRAAQPRDALIGIAAGAAIGLMFSPLLVERPYFSLHRRVDSMSPPDLLWALAGLILGLVVAALLSIPLSFLPWWFGHMLPAAVTLVCVYLGVSFMMMRHRELSGWLQRPESGKLANPTSSNGRLYVDTSAIIDGRIADISQTGFLHGTLVVPRFVLQELQHIADSADPLRRNRGRRGLDMLNKLQKDSNTPVEISDVDARDVSDVDGKLVTLARQVGGAVITNDFNLNRVAELQGVRVLNINQLANALKPVVLPGEEMSVQIIQEGKEAYQGVGYLDDGTMIVVENGRRHLGNEIEVTVTRVLQTVAGRMIFAHPKQPGRE